MNYKNTLALLCTLFFTALSWADQLIVEPDMGRKPILKLIEATQHSLDLVMYGFTDHQLLNSFIQQKNNGKTIKILLQQRPYKNENENNKVISILNKNHLQWQRNIPSVHLIHQKTLIIDNRNVLVMTFNFTHSTFKNERNFGLLIDDAVRVKNISAVFNSDWNHKPVTHLETNTLWSPIDSRAKLLSLIRTAKNEIKMYAQSINDYQIVGALAKAAKKGINIKILTSGKIREKQNNFMEQAGIHIHKSNNLYIHAKAILIDQRKAVIGSINLTTSSLNDNRELSVISYDPKVIHLLNKTFLKDWDW